MKRYRFLALGLIAVLVMGLCFALPYAQAASNYWNDPTGIDTVKVSAHHSIAIKSDGTLWVAGRDTYRKLLSGTGTNYTDFRKIATGVSDAAVGLHMIMMVKTDGTLWSKGSNYNGALGLGSSEFLNQTTYLQVPGIDNVRAVACGEAHTLVLKTDGTLWAFGDSTHGQVGSGAVPSGAPFVPAPVKILDGVHSIETDSEASFAIKTDGSLWAWGRNTYGNIGNGTAADQFTPVKVLDGVVKVCPTYGRTMALKADGSLWAWGSNDEGTFLDGTSISSLTPVKSLDGIRDFGITASSSHVIKEDGHLYSYGAFTDNKTDFKRTLTKVYDNVKFIISGGGSSHILLAMADGSLYALGRNDYGQTGVEPEYITAPSPSASPKPSPSVSPSPTPLPSASPTPTAKPSPSPSPTPTAQHIAVVLRPLRIHIASPNSAYLTKGVGGTLPPPTGGKTAVPTSASVKINGEPVAFGAYNIDGNNYFKLRDLAYALNSTNAAFSVDWDEARKVITLTSGRPYVPVGGEMAAVWSASKSATVTPARLILDGKDVAPTAYLIDGNNFYKLRDIAAALDIGITYEAATKTININTSTSYTA
ncbi:hypothetical protein LJC32_04225 [Oscillospiraceae bacterium OttesenSCG-928-F05]|nr:hypothetical protein [Oscillospiraceae bacterium OttesenSCG-928-F05]